MFFFLKGLHPRIVAEGFELAKKEALAVLDKLKIPINSDRETLIQIARTSLRTKLTLENADILTDVRRHPFLLDCMSSRRTV